MIIGMIIRRYLWPRRAESFLKVINVFSLLGITLGVATLIVVMSVMNGFRQELMAKILQFNSHLTVTDEERSFDDYKTLLPQLVPIHEIKSSIPIIEGQGMISFEGQSFGVSIRAMPYKDLISRRILVDKYLMGDFSSFQNHENTISVGSRLAEKLRLRIDDIVRITIPEGNVTPLGQMPRTQAFKVSAIYGSGVFEYDSGVVFLPFEIAQHFFQKGDRISYLEFFLEDPYGTASVINKIQSVLDRPARYLSWVQANSSFFEVIKIERNVMFIILSLIILIAVFNIISSLIILVKDKTQDVAILKTLGVNSSFVMRIFVGVGMSLGIMGTTAGVFLGVVVSLNLESIRQAIQWLTRTTLFNQEFYFLTELPVHLDIFQIVGIAVMSLSFSIAATLYPSWKASRLNPVEALRYE